MQQTRRSKLPPHTPPPQHPGRGAGASRQGPRGVLTGREGSAEDASELREEEEQGDDGSDFT